MSAQQNEKGQFIKGVSSWNKGMKLPKEWKDKLREAKIKNPVRYWKGRKRPEMTGDNNPNSGKFGKLHPKWTNDKKHPFHKAIREIFKYKEWRTTIFKRDNYKCVLCGDNGYIEADHHPITFSEIIKQFNVKSVDDAITCDKLWDINNGRALCKKCHFDKTFKRD